MYFLLFWLPMICICSCGFICIPPPLPQNKIQLSWRGEGGCGGYFIPINHDIASPYCFPHSLLNPYFAIQTQYQLSVRILIHVTPVLSVCAAEPVWGAAGGEEAGASGHSRCRVSPSSHFSIVAKFKQF